MEWITFTAAHRFASKIAFEFNTQNIATIKSSAIFPFWPSLSTEFKSAHRSFSYLFIIQRLFFTVAYLPLAYGEVKLYKQTTV